MLSYDWGKPIYFSCEWCFPRYVVHIYIAPVSMRLVCLGSGTSAIVFGMVHVSYPPFCTWETAGQRTTDASRVIGFFSHELSPGLKGIWGEQAAGHEHMQHIQNTTQVQSLFLPLPGLGWSPDGADDLGEFFLSFCWVWTCWKLFLSNGFSLSASRLWNERPKDAGSNPPDVEPGQFLHATWHIIPVSVHALNL